MKVFLSQLLTKNIFKPKILAFLLLFIFNILLIVYYADLKTGFHIDELYSYAHSNSTQGAFLSENIDSFFHDTNKDLQNKWIKGEIFHNYLTVQHDEQFKYKHIWDNMAKDVHPPLYYILLHTVCSFFPDMFTKWHGISLNIMLWSLTLLAMFKLSRLFFNDKYIALTPVVCYAFSQIGIDTVIYTRMYLLQTLLALLLIYENILLLNKNKINNRNIFLIFLYSFLGIFTHYNAIIFSFFTAFTTCIILFLRKNWKLLFAYSCAMLCSICLLFVLFPAYDGIFHSQRSADVFYVGWNPIVLIKSVLVFYNSSCALLFNAPIFLLNCILIILFVAYVFINKNNIHSEKNIIFLFSILSVVGTWLVYFMPHMGQFMYRYFMLLFPFFTIFIFYCMYSVIKYFNITKHTIYSIFFILVFLNSINTNFLLNSPYNMQNDVNTDNFIKRSKDKEVIIVTPFIWMLFEHIHYFQNAKKIYVSLDKCDLDVKKQIHKNKEALIMILNKDGKACINCYPRIPTTICGGLRNDIHYLYTVRIGERFYDIYDIL